MDRIKRFIFGSKLKSTAIKSVGISREKTKMTIEETIRRYEQLCAK